MKIEKQDKQQPRIADAFEAVGICREAKYNDAEGIIFSVYIN